MRGLFKVFLIASCFWAALLFWWKPSADVVAVKVVDWAQEYKDEVTDPGSLSMAKSFIRKNSPQPTFDEFINEETKNRLIEVKSNDLQSWIQEYASEPSFDIEKPIYFRLSNPVAPDMPELNLLFGYVKVEGNGLTSYINVNRIETDELGGKGIAASVRYSSRKVAAIFALIFLVFFGLKKLPSSQRDLIAQSTAGTGCRAFMAIFTGGMALIFMPFFYDWMHDFPPFVFMGGFIVICGIIGLIIFGIQWVFASKLLKAGNHLVHWTFSPDEWDDFTGKEYETEQQEKKGLLVVISVIALFVGGVFWLVVQDEGGAFVFLVMVALIALLSVVAIVVPWLNYRRNSKQTGEIFIGKDGLYLNGVVHTWRLLGARLKKCEHITEPFNCVSIIYTYWVMAGRMLYFYRTSAIVRVPIPEGKEAEAQDLIAKLQKSAAKKKKSKK